MTVSSSEEMQLGLAGFDSLKKETPISKDTNMNAMVQRVGKRIASVAKLPNAQWEFVVFQSDEANAFCLPGGKVGVYTGIFQITKDDAGLATVIGHEVAHAVARHGGERMSEAKLIQGGQNLVNAGLANTDYSSTVITAAQLAYGGITKFGRELPHSRDQESEADNIGLTYMARAGYDPEESVKFWQRFSDYNKSKGASGGSAFFRTHPLDATRIADLKSLLPKANQEYQKAKTP